MPLATSLNLRIFAPRPILWGMALFLMGCHSTPPNAPSNAPVLPDTVPDTVIAAPQNTPPPPPNNSYLAQLPPEVTNQLVQLDINIAVPTYLPKNMTLAGYGVGEAGSSSPYYWLVYRDDQNRCFAIEYTASRKGQLSLEKQEPLTPALFGSGHTLYHGKLLNGGPQSLPENDLVTDWFTGEDGFYRLIGAGFINAQPYNQGDCTNIALQEAIAVAESLSYLPTDIRTLYLAPYTPE